MMVRLDTNLAWWDILKRTWYGGTFRYKPDMVLNVFLEDSIS